MVGPAIFVTAVAIAGWARPGYSQASRFLSELGETGASGATAVDVSFALAGLCVLAFAASIGRRAGALLAAAGLGFVVMASSPCSAGCPIAVVNRAATTSDAVHNLAAIVAIAGIGFAALDLGAGALGGSRRYQAASTAAGVGIAVSSMLFLAAVVVAAPLAIGVSERIMVAIGLLWVLATAILRLTGRLEPTT